MAGNAESWFPPLVPAALTLTSVVVPAERLRRKMSLVWLVSGAARLLAVLRKATRLPSLLIDSWSDDALPTVPDPLTLTRVVALAVSSNTKMSAALLVSPETRLLAKLRKATTL